MTSFSIFISKLRDFENQHWNFE